MQAQKTIEVTLDNQISSISFIKTMQELQELCDDGTVFILDRSLLALSQDSSESIYQKYHVSIVELMSHYPHLILSGGEQVKTYSAQREIIDTFFRNTVLRSSRIFAIGGGALCDSVGYAASSYMRGIEYMLVPSTLLAMVDASIGGKTAINAYSHKNNIGSFYVPKKIIIYLEFLQSLPRRQYISGIAEIIKAGMLYDATILTLFESLLKIGKRTNKEEATTVFHRKQAHGRSQKEAHKQTREQEQDSQKDIVNVLKDPLYTTVLLELIERAILVKKLIVEKDFKEQGMRSFLNLGHTFAHAIESNAKQKGLDILHGEAVGLGIRSAIMLGEHLGFTDTHYASRIYALLDALDFPKEYALFDIDTVMESMKRDKKADAQGLRFILQKQQGETEIKYVDESSVREHLVFMNIATDM